MNIPIPSNQTHYGIVGQDVPNKTHEQHSLALPAAAPWETPRGLTPKIRVGRPQYIYPPPPKMDHDVLSQ